MKSRSEVVTRAKSLLSGCYWECLTQVSGLDIMSEDVDLPMWSD